MFTTVDCRLAVIKHHLQRQQSSRLVTMKLAISNTQSNTFHTRACSSGRITVPRLRLTHCAAVNSSSPTPLPIHGPILRLASAAIEAVNTRLLGFKCFIAAWCKKITPQSLQAQFDGNLRDMRLMAMIVPFAAVDTGLSSAAVVVKTSAQFLKIYLLLLFIRVILGWFPTITNDYWERQPLLSLHQVTAPYLNLFTNLLPPLLGSIDLTPLLGFFLLQWVQELVETLAQDVSQEIRIPYVE